MAVVRQPYFKVTYEGRDITEEISNDVVEITYSDSVGDESDEIRITIDDMFGKWKREWRSSNGDKIDLQIGWSKDSALDCGSFQIDEVSYSGDYGKGDTVEITALAIPQTSPSRQLRMEIYENQTLRQIAEKIADRNEWDLVSYFPVVEFEIVQTIGKSYDANKVINTKLLRVVQNRESDLAFINRIGKKFGLTFSVRGSNMYFLLSYDIEKIFPIQEVVVYENTDITTQADLNSQSSIALKSYRLKDCAENIKSGVDVRSNNPFTNEAFIYRLDNNQTWAQYMVELINSYGLDSLRRIEDRLQVFEFVENQQQAELVASAALYACVSKQVTGDMEMEGLPKIVAGVSFNVSGIGSLSGRYFTEKSRHRISRSGYTTNVEVRQLQAFEQDPATSP